ncbi:gamma-glutamyltransferase family protein [Profundibacterium mesophilum]|uniref:Gamma-glutamyltranspeptidase n=1 Tax=Profundibacterium mesophilum KAUST100406-0324 TaxID=1037889 RepID=A0A921TDP3_9RHOB|nr:gamma-glutamyltransferase family protein [Profundibacterium mesophilum]KAF0676546.1 gamma-glutamyltranspeptidase [Profundibacterium mesophilum KAUST100406-0324]
MPRDFQLPGRSAVFAENGMCATSHPLAAKVAVQMLEAGGNAVDAAIAGAVLLGICEPQMTGLGGDCFVLLTPPGEDRIVALNGSGRGPAALDPDALRTQGHTVMPLREAASVTVPGAVDAFCRLSEDWGRMGLASALAPAVHYARAGVPVAPRTAFDWAMHRDALGGEAKRRYLLDGAPPRAGQMFRAPMTAELLTLIATEGRAGFYEGAAAEDMVACLRAAGGSHTLEDFAATQSTYENPIAGNYGPYELVEHPPNGQGAAAILLANILSHFDIASLDPVGAERAHLEAEATKLAYDARNRFIADGGTRLDHLLSPHTAGALAALIDPGRAMSAPAQLSEQVHRDTVYITVVDRDRMAVSLIYSIFHPFGSGIASERFGVLMHNRGAGFSLEAGHPNEAGGGKRPMHTIIPAMLRRKGRLLAPFGVMGGAYQATGHARFVSNLADFGMTPQDAIDMPRCFFDAGELRVERGYSDAVRADLAGRGHTVTVSPSPIGGAQAIRIDPDSGILEGASDPRKDGCALGY